MFQEIKGKKVLFISTKNTDYLRNTQETRLLGEQADTLDVIAYADKSYFRRIIKIFWTLLFKKCRKYDVVFVGFAPQLIVPFWNWKFKKNTLYIDFFISVYDTMCFDRKKFSPSSFVGKQLLKLDKNTLNKADKIIADTRAHAEFFSKDLGADPGKCEILYLEADKEIYFPHQAERPEEAAGKYVVLYFGSVLPLQGVDVVLKAMEMLSSNEKFCFYVIGPINGKLNVPKKKSIHYISWLNQERLSDYIAFSDLCLAGHFCGNIEKAKRTIPGKAYIYRAMEKPMILGDNSANHELFSEKDKDIRFVSMGDAKALADAILEMSGEESGKC